MPVTQRVPLPRRSPPPRRPHFARPHGRQTAPGAISWERDHPLAPARMPKLFAIPSSFRVGGPGSTLIRLIGHLLSSGALGHNSCRFLCEGQSQRASHVESGSNFRAFFVGSCPRRRRTVKPADANPQVCRRVTASKDATASKREFCGDPSPGREEWKEFRRGDRREQAYSDSRSQATGAREKS